jgi:pimeloyl-ACP methyl ester carboxylesterase
VITLAIVVVVLLLVVGHYVASIRRFRLDVPYALVERLRTPDGAWIELRRLPGETTSVLPPVLCVHGVAIDHRNVDMREELSIARTLRARGRDVWLLTLRSGIDPAPWLHGRRVRFDPMVRHDLRMALEEVRARTGCVQLDYVGFSMGGMLLYAALGASIGIDVVRRVVILGSPGRLVPPFRVVAWLARVPRWLVPTLPLRLASRMVAFMVDWFTTPIHSMIYNPRNVERGIAGSALLTIRDVAQPLMADLAGMLARGGALVFEGAPVLPTLAHVRIPVRFFAGGGDRIAPPETVREAFEAWGADEVNVDKTLTLLEAASHGADYGHGDLAVGRNVARDVFEPAAAFLDAA